MNKMAEACVKCPNVYGCIYNDFKSCPKIEKAADGLGVPFKPKNTSWKDNIPFGVHQGLKHLVNIISKSMV